jgi:hypothetical protein
MVGVSFQALTATSRKAVMIEAINSLGLNTGLKLCLDAGDINSYSGSGQKWLDTSGNGYDFDFGASGSVEGVDPTFSGTAGRQSASEYINFADGDYMEYDTSNETWMNNLHKNNALFTIATWAFVPTINDTVCIICGDNGGNTTDIGISLFVRQSTSVLALNVNRGTSGSNALTLSGSAVNINAWNFLALSLDEAGNSATMQVNGTQTSHSATYSSPSASNASYTFRLADDGDASIAAQAGFRLANFSAWESVALSATAVDNLYQATRSKFGL